MSMNLSLYRQRSGEHWFITLLIYAHNWQSNDQDSFTLISRKDDLILKKKRDNIRVILIPKSSVSVKIIKESSKELKMVAIGCTLAFSLIELDN